MRSTVNQLLYEMDGATGNNHGVFVTGATNQLWDVDSALRRPGRFDRSLFVMPPDIDARKAILRYHLTGWSDPLRPTTYCQETPRSLTAEPTALL